MRTDFPLAALTTLALGGRAARFVEAIDDEHLVHEVSGVDERGEPLLILGGGSNVVVGDDGFAGTVVGVGTRGITTTKDAEREGSVLLDASAGEEWDDLVARTVAEGWCGIESISGVPGKVGATPIQNVGAYGQEVSETLVRVKVYDRRTRALVDMDAAACGLSYRSSIFKAKPHTGGPVVAASAVQGRFVVVRVVFRFVAQKEGVVRYAELARALGCKEGDTAPLETIRDTVLRLRRAKGMVVDASDPDSVSAGSFFVNPVVDAATLARVAARVPAGVTMPRFSAENGMTKLSAGWLVEQAGFAKGYAQRGGDARVGVSQKHALALVNRGGGSATELLALARAIQNGVQARFGLVLVPEPVFVGCAL